MEDVEDDLEATQQIYSRVLDRVRQRPILAIIGVLLVITVAAVWVYPMTIAPQPKPKTTANVATAVSPTAEASLPVAPPTAAPPQLATPKPEQAYPAPGSGGQPSLPAFSTPSAPSPTPQPGTTVRPPLPAVPTLVASASGQGIVTVTPRPNTQPIPPVISNPPEAIVNPAPTAAATLVDPMPTSTPAPTATPTITPTPGPTTVNIPIPGLQGGMGLYQVIDARAGSITATWQVTGNSAVQMFLYQGMPFGPGSRVIGATPGGAMAMSGVSNKVSIVPMDVPAGTYTIYFYSGSVSSTNASSGLITYTPQSPPVSTPAAGSTPAVTSTPTVGNPEMATPTPTRTPTSGDIGSPTPTRTPVPPSPTSTSAYP